MDGDLMIALRWLEQAGYIVDRESHSIVRVPDKTKKQTYLEHIAEVNGWKVTVVRLTVKKRKKMKMTEWMEREHILDTVRMQRKTEAVKKWKAAKDEAWQRCKQASPTKVVHYNLGTCPMTEREQALIEYYMVALGDPFKGIGG